MGLQWIMHCTFFDNCVWLLFCIFTCLCIVCADVPQTVGERKLLSVEGDAVTQPGLRIREVRNVSSNLPQCVKLGGSELLALHSDGDVVIGGFFHCMLHLIHSTATTAIPKLHLAAGECKGTVNIC